MTSFPEHPGVVIMVNAFDDSLEALTPGDLPEDMRFVHTNGGLVPVVEVRVVPFDEQGHVVPQERAKYVRVVEYGPQRTFLRSTMAAAR